MPRTRTAPISTATEAEISFYTRKDGDRRVLLLVGGHEIHDVRHDASMYAEMDRALLKHGLARTDGFRLDGQRLTARLRSTAPRDLYLDRRREQKRRQERERERGTG